MPPAVSASKHIDSSTAAPRRGRWVVVLLVALFCLMGWVSWVVARSLGATTWGFQPPAMAAAQYSTQDVIGDLGGMPVRISRFVAEYVEYEGDPGWSGPRKGPPPERTYASRLMSFGFAVRYPDMAMLTSSEMWADKRRYTIYTTPWMSVGVTTGPHYPGRGFMNRRDMPRGQVRSEDWWRDYIESREKVFGLDEYRLAKPPPPSPISDPRNPILQYGETIYFHRDDAGNVLTRIECSDVPHLAALCTQSWDGNDQGMAAKVYVQYRRELLPYWREIQKGVNQTILGFRMPPYTVPEQSKLPASQIPMIPAISSQAT